MPAKSSEISPVERVVCMYETVNVIRRVLLISVIAGSDLLCFSKWVFWIFIIEDVKAMIIDFNAIGIGPHLKLLIFSLNLDRSKMFVMFYDTNFWIGYLQPI